MMDVQTPIAVIGIGCRFPHAEGTDAFWRNLAEGRSCIEEIPAERLDASRVVGIRPGVRYDMRAGMDATGDCYDADFFQIDADERARMDPQQGLVLELAWHACEDAGIAPDRLAGAPVGVFVGISTCDFDRRMADQWQQADLRASTGASGAIIANRVSYQFGFTGPSMSIDGACTASLMALHAACRSLADGECELALAGGVQLILSAANIVAFTHSGALARDGRCKPFSADADGYVCGEGGGLVLLKPLDHALRDGDHIRAVVRGSAVNHNGRSNGLSAPYRQAQRQVMLQALARAGLSPFGVDYVEAHAVGTPVGDAIEIQAVRDVYGDGRAQDQPCRLGSVKSNIGHLEAASGIASFVKTVLMLERAAIPPSLHSDRPSPTLRLEKGGVALSDALRAWPRSATPASPRRAGVSAFSFGGSNAHVVVEQAPPPSQSCADAVGPWPLLFSAASEAAFERLRLAYIETLRACRDRGEPLAALRDICSSSIAGRRLLPLRRALVVGDWDEAIDALECDLAPAPAAHDAWRVALPLSEGASDAAWPGIEALLADTPPESRTWLHPVVLFSQLGLQRIAYDDSAAEPAGSGRDLESTDASRLREAARYAIRLGMTVIRHGESPIRPAQPVLCVPAPDALQESPAACLARVCAEGLERGIVARWSACEALFGAGRFPLPLYPFERSRNHVLPEERPALAAVSAVPEILSRMDTHA